METISRTTTCCGQTSVCPLLFGRLLPGGRGLVRGPKPILFSGHSCESRAGFLVNTSRDFPEGPTPAAAILTQLQAEPHGKVPRFELLLGTCQSVQKLCVLQEQAHAELPGHLLKSSVDFSPATSGQQPCSTRRNSVESKNSNTSARWLRRATSRRSDTRPTLDNARVIRAASCHTEAFFQSHEVNPQKEGAGMGTDKTRLQETTCARLKSLESLSVC